MGVEIHVGTLVIGVDERAETRDRLGLLPAEAPAFSLGERGTPLERTVPIAVRHRVAGLLNGYARTCVFSDARRPPATRGNGAICAFSRASDSGIPVALPVAVAATIQNGVKTSRSTERLEARVGCVITPGISSWTHR
jgi:hypothetical protein